MAYKKRPLAPRLPQNLIEEINAEENGHAHKSGRGGHKLSRKDTRKQERETKKQRRAEFFSHTSNPKKRPADDHVESPQRKKTKHDDTSVVESMSSQTKILVAKKSSSKEKVSSEEPKKSAEKTKTKPEKKPKLTALEKLAGGSSSSAKPARKGRVEEEEDAYISYLESKLGFSGGKRKKSAEDDGLDDLLDLVDNIGVPSAMDEDEDEDEDKDGFAGADGLEEGSESEIMPKGFVDEELDDEDDEYDNTFVPDEEEESVEQYEEWGGIKDESSQEDDEGEEKNTKQVLPDTTPKPTAGGAYVPPHLRKAQANEQSEEMLRLTRQLKGLLNRMSEQNLGTILDGIEEIYRNHRRNDVTSTITNLIIEGVSNHALLLDSYVVLHAAFVSSLHKIIGIEFGAHFVQNVVTSYEEHYVELKAAPDTVSGSAQEGQEDTRGKECSNLIVLLSELYNFQVISCVLVFDLIRGFLTDALTEFNVELLLKIVRNSGQQLRIDDPLALKDIITIVQDKVAAKGSDISSRTRFMIETLTNLKNNKLKRNVTQNQGAPAVERMKKFLSGLGKKKHILAHEPLRVSLDDLHSAGTKGKWWLVGAAWGGDPLVEKQDDIAAKSKLSQQAEEVKDPANNLLQLARKQGMNTDIRRSIFVVLMSSEDFMDACERLSQLNLTEFQQREIIRVLLHCCGNEKTYNPYYALVGQHLCRNSHSYRITVQFSLWDFLRDLGETTVGGAEVVKNAKDYEAFDIKNISKTRIMNVARAYAWWIAKDSVSLTVLKPVDFTALKSQSRDFLREMMAHILISSQTSTPIVSSDLKGIPTTRNRSTIEEIFIKGSRVQGLAMGLVYFLSENFRDFSYEDENVAKFMKWAVGLARDTLRTGLDVIPTL